MGDWVGAGLLSGFAVKEVSLIVSVSALVALEEEIRGGRVTVHTFTERNRLTVGGAQEELAQEPGGQRAVTGYCRHGDN